jgi:hypothetical protein
MLAHHVLEAGLFNATHVESLKKIFATRGTVSAASPSLASVRRRHASAELWSVTEH